LRHASDHPRSTIFLAPLVAGFLFIGAVPLELLAQDSSTSGSSEEGIDPDLIGPFRIRHYKIRPKKLWKGLLVTLEHGGFPPEEIDDKGLIVKTSFVDFASKDYPGDVAEPPPLLGVETHIVQMKTLRGGKLSFEAHVSKGSEGTELKIRARILGEGMDRRKRMRVLVDRRSTGIIETEFFKQLEARLGLTPL
jgi:hypothetical protein